MPRREHPVSGARPVRGLSAPLHAATRPQAGLAAPGTRTTRHTNKTTEGKASNLGGLLHKGGEVGGVGGRPLVPQVEQHEARAGLVLAGGQAGHRRPAQQTLVLVRRGVHVHHEPLLHRSP